MCVQTCVNLGENEEFVAAVARDSHFNYCVFLKGVSVLKRKGVLSQVQSCAFVCEQINFYECRLFLMLMTHC